MSNRYDADGFEILDPEDCLNYHEGDCEGAVEYRMPLSGTGKSFPRCDKHWSDRLDTQERLTRDYGVPFAYTGNPRDYEDDADFGDPFAYGDPYIEWNEANDYY